MDVKTRTWVVLGVWSAYVVFWLIYAQRISEIIVASGLIVGIILYLLGNPAYLILIYSIYEYGRKHGRTAWKNVVASVLMIIGFDMATLPRLAITDPLTNGTATSTNIGSIVMRGLEQVFPHNVSYYLLYLVLPIALIAMAVELLGITNFIKEVRR